MTRQITFEEVKKHKHKNSVWMIIHNDVYDVTSFLNEHPGGEETLLDYAGKDGTQGFEDVSHSEDARELLKKYKIGTLPPHQQNKNIPSCCKWKSRKKPSRASRSKCSICSASSCPHLPKTAKPDNVWRTFDGSCGSRTQPIKTDSKKSNEPRLDRRVRSITVPRDNNNNNTSTGYNKWAIAAFALAGALVLGIVLKKYLAR